MGEDRETETTKSRNTGRHFSLTPLQINKFDVFEDQVLLVKDAETQRKEAERLAFDERYPFLNYIPGYNVILPNSSFRVYWDILIAILVIYLSFYIPYSISFKKGKDTNVLTYSMDAIFWVSYYFIEEVDAEISILDNS